MKKTFLIAAVLMATSLVQADVISWRVDLGVNNGTFVTAQLYATLETGGSYWSAAATAQELQNVGQYETYGVIGRTTTLGAGIDSNYSFFVKLLDVGGTMVSGGYSELKSWSEMVDGGFLASGITPDLPANYWNAVPEPTSIGLLAIGMSALLLRRRRRS